MTDKQDPPEQADPAPTLDEWGLAVPPDSWQPAADPELGLTTEEDGWQ